MTNEPILLLLQENVDDLTYIHGLEKTGFNTRTESIGLIKKVWEDFSPQIKKRFLKPVDELVDEIFGALKTGVNAISIVRPENKPPIVTGYRIKGTKTERVYETRVG